MTNTKNPLFNNVFLFANVYVSVTGMVALHAITKHERIKISAYLVIGLLFIVAGAVLIFVARKHTFPSSITTTEDIREALHQDRTRDSLNNGGIAICTSGLLIMLGFGLTEFLSAAFK